MCQQGCWSLREVDCEIPRQLRKEQSIIYKGVETSHKQTRFKNLEGKSKRENPKRTTSASGGLGLLQIGQTILQFRYLNNT